MLLNHTEIVIEITVKPINCEDKKANLNMNTKPN